MITCIRQVVEPKLVSSTVKVHPLATLAAVYFSLVGRNIWILFYVLGLCTLYGAFRDTGALPSLVETDGEMLLIPKKGCLPLSRQPFVISLASSVSTVCQKFFTGSQAYTDAQQMHGLLQLLLGRERGGHTDVAVIGSAP